jgi:hypothetical protein
MSFLVGQTKETTPQDVQGVRKSIEDYIFGTQQFTPGPGSGFQSLLHGTMSRQGGVGLDALINGVPQSLDTAPFEKMFAERRAQALAQAKEQAGNLTGSGLGNTLGVAAGRSAADENAFLANLQYQARQASAQRLLALLGGIPNFNTGTAYQPGLLDYGAQAATALASGGAFGAGGLFGGPAK